MMAEIQAEITTVVKKRVQLIIKIRAATCESGGLCFLCRKLIQLLLMKQSREANRR